MIRIAPPPPPPPNSGAGRTPPDPTVRADRVRLLEDLEHVATLLDEIVHMLPTLIVHGDHYTAHHIRTVAREVETAIGAVLVQARRDARNPTPHREGSQ